MRSEALKPILLPNLGHFAAAIALSLVVLGIFAIATARGDWAYAYKQLVFVPIGLGVMVFAAAVHYRTFSLISGVLMALVMVMLIVVLLPFMPASFIPVINGARRWFDLGFVSFQPSELMKVVFVLALARYLRYRENYRTLRGLLPPLLITFLPMALILVEPDLGTAMIFLPVLFAMLIAAGARIKHLILILLIGVALMPALYPLLQPHQKARIKDVAARLVGDTRHSQSISFQGATATRLIGSGQLLGHDAQHAGNLIRHNRLPEAHNDMIFAVICIRWGLAGGLAVLLLYFILIVTALAVAAMNKDPYARLIIVGIVAIIFTQVFVNVGMTVGLLPITGMTLPLISYGGSSLLVNLGMIGLILNVASRRPMIMAKPSFEYDS